MPPGPIRVQLLDAQELAETSGVLAAFGFAANDQGGDASVIHFATPILTDPPRFEVWSGDRPVTRTRIGRISLAQDGLLLFGTIRAEEAHGALEETARLAYEEVLATVRDTGYQHLVRMWNAIPRINEDEAGLERYRRFCLGRHEAFNRFGYRFEGDLPAASGVGSGANDLRICFLAARVAATTIENPRQVSAYRYPPRYGPRGPSFARATVMDNGSAGRQIFLSGTASIVGHESRHAGCVTEQVEETLRNIDRVIEGASCGMRSEGGMFTGRVYLRDASDLDRVERILTARWRRADLVFLRSDICRKELLVEIEGVVTLPAPPL